VNLGLGTALALLAGIVLLALLGHGWWKTRQARPRGAPDSLLPADRVEPAMGGEAPGAAEAPALRTTLRKPARLDALIDAIVPLALDAPVSGDHVLQHLPPSRRAGSKPFYVEGLDTETGDWEAPAAGRRYGELQAGVQMANRSGALNEIEYSEFMQKVQAFAEGVGANLEGAQVPDMLDVVARARELDGLAGPLDAQLTITLRANGVAWSWAYLQQAASRLGLVPGAVPGRLVLPADEEGAPPVLALAVDAQAALAALGEEAGAASGVALRACTLTLDVPQTPAAAEPFPAWHKLAQRLCDDLDATAVDDDGQPITLHAFAAIGQELQQLYGRLEALDLAAGSAAARRLFS
jgi:hypothetical protein